MTFHLGPDTSVAPEAVESLIREGAGLVRFTNDFKLIRIVEDSVGTPTDTAIQVLRTLVSYAIKSH